MISNIIPGIIFIMIFIVYCSALFTFHGFCAMLSPVIVISRVIHGIIYNVMIYKSWHFYSILGLLDLLLIGGYLLWCAESQHNREQISWKIYPYALILIAMNYHLRYYSIEYNDSYDIFIDDIYLHLSM